MRLFGAPRVSLAGSPLTFETRKAVALLAYLAVTGRSQRREFLAALLWPESDEARSRASLRRTLSAASSAGPALVVSRHEIGLDPTSYESDVIRFKYLAQGHDMAMLVEAAEVGREPFLSGFSLRGSTDFDDWAAATAGALRDRLADVLARLTSMGADTGRLDEAIEWGRRWLDVDPLSEVAHRELMRLYAATGERHAALKQYRRCVRILDQDLGVTPLPETASLYDDIRANRFSVPSPRPEKSASAATRPSAARAADTQEPASASIGRADEVTQLTSAWRAAKAGRSAAVIGASGCGRTTLTRHLRERVASAEGAVVVIRGHEAESTLAYSAVVDLSKALVGRRPELESTLEPVGRAVDTPGERVRLFDTVRDTLTLALSGPVPGLLVIDDAHWLDHSSAELFGYLMRRPPIGVLVLATWNDEGSEGFDLADESILVSLQPWSRSDVATALAALGHPQLDPAEVHRRTGGNPRLLVEFCLASRSSTAPVSGALDEMMAHRLDGADETTRQILSATAVLGTVADPTLIRLVSGRDELEVVEALEQAVTRGLLVEDIERIGYDFPYDSLRDLVNRRIGLARRRLLNGRAADALVRQFSAETQDVPAARVARHLAAAGREDEARDWYWSAAQRSSALYAHREALGHLEAALALGYQSSLVHTAAGDALIRLGEYRRALTSYEKAAAAIDVDDWESLSLVEHKLAEVHDRLGEWEVARAHLESASDLLDPQGSPAMRAQVRADLALVMQRQGEPEAEVVALAALELAEESGDPVALSQAHNVLGVIALERGHVDESERHLTTSGDFASTAEDVALQVASLNNLARLRDQAGSLDSGLEAATEALELGIRHGDRHRIAALHNHRADLLHRAGREDDAMWHQKQAAAIFADVDQAQGRPEVWKLVSW